MAEAIDPDATVSLVLSEAAGPQSLALKVLLYEVIERDSVLGRETALAGFGLPLLVAVDRRLLAADLLTAAPAVNEVLHPPDIGTTSCSCSGRSPRSAPASPHSTAIKAMPSAPATRSPGRRHTGWAPGPSLVHARSRLQALRHLLEDLVAEECNPLRD
jgi:hypothetical protein